MFSKSAFIANLAVILLVLLAFFTRFIGLAQPAQLVFDEVHFGKFVSGYFNHEYFFDIHPPLGKLLIGGMAKLSGWQPGFDFEAIGENYDARDLWILRFLPALAGVLLVLLVYKVIRILGGSKKAAFLAAFLVLFDNAFLVQSRYLLMDIFLLVFGLTAFVFFMLSRKEEALPCRRYVYLLFCGIFLGLTISIKWTGVAVVGVAGLVSLVKILKDFYKTSWVHKIKEAIVMLIAFVLIPFSIYLGSFAIHFSLLRHSGTGDAFMSPAFQKTLVGSRYYDESIAPAGFVDKFSELNRVMYTSSAGLTAQHTYSSKWYQWPLMRKAIWYWHGESGQYPLNVYLLGNPLAWWFVLLFLPLALFSLFSRGVRERLGSVFYILILVYLANLLPFIFIKRVSFLYHYLPSLTYGIILASWWVDKILLANVSPKKIKTYKKQLLPEKNFLGFATKKQLLGFGGFLTAVFLMFLAISPLSYGYPIAALPKWLQYFVAFLLV